MKKNTLLQIAAALSGAIALLMFILSILHKLFIRLSLHNAIKDDFNDYGIIGGSDGPTSMFNSHNNLKLKQSLLIIFSCLSVISIIVMLVTRKDVQDVSDQ